MNIMFICTGNICRSAMAHRLIEKKLKEKNINDINVFSCGVYAQNNDMPTNEGISIMKEYGVDLSIHRATNIYKSSIREMDLILCATEGHKRMVIDIFPELQKKIFTMKEYAGYDNNINISDPWGSGFDVYRKCAQEIDMCTNKILEKILQ